MTTEEEKVLFEKAKNINMIAVYFTRLQDLYLMDGVKDALANIDLEIRSKINPHKDEGVIMGYVDLLVKKYGAENRSDDFIYTDILAMHERYEKTHFEWNEETPVYLCIGYLKAILHLIKDTFISRILTDGLVDTLITYQQQKPNVSWKYKEAKIRELEKQRIENRKTQTRAINIFQRLIDAFEITVDEKDLRLIYDQITEIYNEINITHDSEAR